MNRFDKSVSGFVAMCCVVLLPSQAGAQSEEHSAPLQLRYLGAAGWEISDGNIVVLIDPYISRLKYGGGGHPDDDRPNFARDDVAQSDTDLIDSMNLASSDGSQWSDPDFRSWEGSSGNIHEFDWSNSARPSSGN